MVDDGGSLRMKEAGRRMADGWRMEDGCRMADAAE